MRAETAQTGERDPAGHQVRIEVAGSNFPLADRNWHAGERNDLASDGPVAHITLHHGATHPSALQFVAYTSEVMVNAPMVVPWYATSRLMTL